MNRFVKYIIGIAALTAAIVLVVFSSSKSSSVSGVENITGPEAKAIESVGLGEFDSSNDVRVVISQTDKSRYKEVLDAMELGGDLKDVQKVAKAKNALDDLIGKYPDYADLYVLRAIDLFVIGAQYDSINSDLDAALKYFSSKKYISSYNSTAPIYLLKAKADALKENTDVEVDDLMSAVNADVSKALSTDFFGTGAVAPDTDGFRPTSLTLSDFNSLIKKYPTDFRAYLLRGLYYASFSTFKEEYNDSAVSDLKQAITLQPQSATANYLLGELYMRMTFWTMKAASDVSDLFGSGGGYKDQLRKEALVYFNQAASADSTYKYAYAGLAEANLELKNYPEAIKAYSREIELDPNNASAYNDRAITETDIKQFTLAVSDLSKSIEIKEKGLSIGTSASDLYLNMAYQNLGDAEAKSGDYQAAVADYSKAIGTKLGSLILLMSVDQIRTIYPEFKGLSDQTLLEGLRQKYYPQISSVDFNSAIVKNKSFSTFLLSDLYVGRGDAYLKAGDRLDAGKDYTRAVRVDSTYYKSLTPEQQSVYDSVN